MADVAVSPHFLYARLFTLAYNHIRIQHPYVPNQTGHAQQIIQIAQVMLRDMYTVMKA